MSTPNFTHACRQGLPLLLAGLLSLISGAASAQDTDAGLTTAPSDAGAGQHYSQRLIVVGNKGNQICNDSGVSADVYDCHAAETAPTAAQRTMTITSGGKATASLVVTYDGFGSGEPVIAVSSRSCNILRDPQSLSAQQLASVQAQFEITPVHGAARTITTELLPPRPADFLRKSSTRAVYALPALQQTLTTSAPVVLGDVAPGDRIKLRLLAVGSRTACRHNQLVTENFSTNLWGPSSTQSGGYQVVRQRTEEPDDTHIAPFRAVAVVSY